LRGRKPGDFFENDIMHSSVSCSRIPAWKPLALVSALSTLFIAPAQAQSNTDKTLAPVVVTASRFASDPAFSPIGATVITADQIREAGIGNASEAVRKLGGVYGRLNFAGTQDFNLDLRGFGGSSDQNLVVVVDGVRISENELTPALLSSIPVESIERIEIIRGGSSVLYGEGATGGVIQVITKGAGVKQLRGSVVAELGSFNHRELRASVAKGGDGFALDANIGNQYSDNYRDNNAVRQQNFSGGLQWSSKEGKAGLRVESARQGSRFPGSLTLAQFEANPRQTLKPNDFGSTDSDRVTLSAERRFGAWEAAVELSHREKTTRGLSDSSFGAFDSRADTRVTQFSPRLRHLAEAGNVKNELVAGLDFARWNQLTDSTFGGFPVSDANASQHSRALYVRDEVRIGAARIAAGARHETFDKDFSDPIGFPTTGYVVSHALNAWELQGSYVLTPAATVFAKAGQSYRVANVDENGGTLVANQPLAPQISHDLELGATIGQAERKVTAKVFRHRVKNEIFLDPTIGFFGANVNLDPTQRQGVELEANARLATAFTLSASLQHLNAKFTDGPNAGKEMTMVPKNTATVRLSWLPGNGQNADVGVQWVDSQRYGNDFTNTCPAKMPSFATIDGRYARQYGAWEFALSGTNLTNKDYFTTATRCQFGIYPEAGRQLKISARYDF
jgi:iron complex outermembrane recepter protein